MNKKFRKILAIVLTLVLCTGLMAGCSGGNSAADQTIPVHVQGAIFGGNSDDDIALDLNFSMNWITKDSNTKYNANLAQFSALLSSDIYFREKDYAKATQNRVIADETDEADYTVGSILGLLGFSDIEFIESSRLAEYDTDANDNVTMGLAYCNANEKYDVFIVTLRGCYAYTEWMSAFDIGSTSEDYIEYTGEHTEWTDTDVYKGFSVSANRAIELINEYISEHDDSSRKNCILVTGHSRGAGLADIIGAYFEDDKDFRSYTYAFNTPLITSDKSAENYKTIFNVFDSSDFFANIMPFENEKYYRYGKTLSENISNSEEIKSEIANLKGRDDYKCIDVALISEYEILFQDRFDSRDSLYEFKLNVQTFDSEYSAEKYYKKLVSAIGSDNGFGIDDLCTVEVRERDNGEYSVILEYCDAAIFMAYSKLLAYGDSVYSTFTNLFSFDDRACEIADFILKYREEMSAGHLLINSYVLTQFVE